MNIDEKHTILKIIIAVNYYDYNRQKYYEFCDVSKRLFKDGEDINIEFPTSKEYELANTVFSFVVNQWKTNYHGLFNYYNDLSFVNKKNLKEFLEVMEKYYEHI